MPRPLERSGEPKSAWGVQNVLTGLRHVRKGPQNGLVA